MPETFFALLAAGVMLAVAVPRPVDVTLQWLRLGGIIALVMAGLSIFFWMRSDESVNHAQAILNLVVVLLILGQLAATQTSRRIPQRLAAIGAFICGVTLGCSLNSPTSPANRIAIITSCAGIAAVLGLALMDMLLGHAYLTASKMTIHPFRRLNNTLGLLTIGRLFVSIGGVLWLNYRSPAYLFWAMFGLYAITRWLIGLALPLFFIYMARDCINRRATQSATGILYVAGVLIFIGELLALYLVRETHLPF